MILTKNQILKLNNSIPLLSFVSDVVGSEFTKSGKEYKIKCPFPDHSETEPSFTITKDKNVFYCFGCKRGGGVYQFVSHYINSKNSKEILSFIEKYADIDVDIINNDDVLFINDVIEFLVKECLVNKDVINYLYDRGLDDDDIVKYRIGYSKNYDRLIDYINTKHNKIDRVKYIMFDDIYEHHFDDGIIFPVFDEIGVFVGFTYHFPHKSGINRYKNSTTDFVNYKDVLYGIDDLDFNKNVVIVEGIFDKISLDKMGYVGLAMRGTKISEFQLKYLNKYGYSSIIYAVDGDSAGNRFLLSQAESDVYKSIGITPYVYQCDDGFDPNDYLRHNKNFDILSSISLTWFAIKYKYSNNITKNEINVDEFINISLKYLKHSSTKMSAVVISQISKYLSIPVDEIYNMLYEELNITYYNAVVEKQIVSNVIDNVAMLFSNNIMSKMFYIRNARDIILYFENNPDHTKYHLLKHYSTDVKMMSFINDLPASDFSAMTSLVKILNVNYNKRAVAFSLKKAMLAINDNDVSDVLSYVDNLLYNTTNDFEINNSKTVLKDIITDVKNNSLYDRALYLSDKWRRTNLALHGFNPNKLVILAGSTGHGKTNIALNWVRDLTIIGGAPALYFSGEMSERELLYRLIQMESGVSHDDLLSGKDETLIAVNSIYSNDNYNKLYISTNIEMYYMINTIKYYKKKHDIKYVVIDYAQLVDLTKYKNMPRYQQLKEMTRELKTIVCQELDMFVILLAQQDSQALDDKIPKGRRISESKLMIADSDVSIAIKKKEYEDEYPGNIIMHIDKVRYAQSNVIFGLMFKSNLVMEEA